METSRQNAPITQSKFPHVAQILPTNSWRSKKHSCLSQSTVCQAAQPAEAPVSDIFCRWFFGVLMCFGWHGVEHYSGKNPTGCVSADVWRFHVDLDLLASGRRSQASGDRGQSPWPMVCCDLWGPCFVGFSIVFSVSHGSFNSLI